jgi:hypothetical protein
MLYCIIMLYYIIEYTAEQRCSGTESPIKLSRLRIGAFGVNYTPPRSTNYSTNKSSRQHCHEQWLTHLRLMLVPCDTGKHHCAHLMRHTSQVLCHTGQLPISSRCLRFSFLRNIDCWHDCCKPYLPPYSRGTPTSHSADVKLRTAAWTWTLLTSERVWAFGTASNTEQRWRRSSHLCQHNIPELRTCIYYMPLHCLGCSLMTG